MAIKIVTNKNVNFSIRYETFEGRKYLVAPVIMVQEQVLNESFLPGNEIAKSVNGWNGRPVVVYHPINSNGWNISANDPKVLQKYQIGFIFNTEYDPQNKQLKSEIWLDVNKAENLNNDSRKVLNDIINGNKVEVSTGYYSKEEVVNNEYGYEFIDHDILPDHLALLPNAIGACSFKDGCGVRANCNNCQECTCKGKNEGVNNLATETEGKTKTIIVKAKLKDNQDVVTEVIIDEGEIITIVEDAIAEVEQEIIQSVEDDIMGKIESIIDDKISEANTALINPAATELLLGNKKKEPVLKVENKTMEEYINDIPCKDVRDYILNAQTEAKKRREDYIEQLKNYDSLFEEEELQTFTTNQLEKIIETTKPKNNNKNKTNYSSRGIPSNDDINENLGYVPLTVNIFDKKEVKEDK